MKTQTLAGLVAFPLAVMAAPAWTMVAYNESVPAIHGKPINADSGAFWLNKDAAAVCPDYDPECPATNTTIISGPTNGNNGWWMGILQSGGQAISAPGLDSTLGGLTLKYEAVGAGDIGVGVWDVARDSYYAIVLDNSTISTLGAPTIHAQPYSGRYTWMACPYPEVYPGPESLDQVDLSKPMTVQTVPLEDVNDWPACVRLEITLKPTTLAAPQYYYCKGCQWRCDSLYGDNYCQLAYNTPACLEPFCGPYTNETKADKVV